MNTTHNDVLIRDRECPLCHGAGIVPADDPTANRLGRWGKSAPSTSRLAALRNYPRNGTQRGRILQWIQRRGDVGATVDEAEIASGWSHQTTSARVNELMNGGWIVDSGQKRRTRNRTPATVWKAAPHE